MEIVTLENGPFMVNSFLVINDAKKSAIIIDPGFDVSPLLQRVKDQSLSLRAIVATHGHLDHVEGVNKVKEKFAIPFYANRGDEQLMENLSLQARMFGVSDPGTVKIDEALPDSGTVELGGLNLELLHTPGHSQGSLSIKIENTVFAGDTLFNFSIGRTDLPGGDYGQLIASIQNKLFTLPDETRILPGHGPETTVGHEKRMNPFFN